MDRIGYTITPTTSIGKESEGSHHWNDAWACHGHHGAGTVVATWGCGDAFLPATVFTWLNAAATFSLVPKIDAATIRGRRLLY